MLFPVWSVQHALERESLLRCRSEGTVWEEGSCGPFSRQSASPWHPAAPAHQFCWVWSPPSDTAGRTWRLVCVLLRHTNSYRSCACLAGVVASSAQILPGKHQMHKHTHRKKWKWFAYKDGHRSVCLFDRLALFFRQVHRAHKYSL